MFEFYNFVSFKWDNGDRDFLIFFLNYFALVAGVTSFKALSLGLKVTLAVYWEASIMHYYIIMTSLIHRYYVNAKPT
jgi:hypothetical protein